MAVKITTGFGISSEQSPVCNGVLKFNFTPAKLSEATSTTSVLSIAEVPANTQIVVTDAWLVVNTAYQTGTSIMVGDSAYDNNVLADTDISSTGTKATSSGSKGQLLSNSATGLVTTRLTITLTASTAVSLHSAGDVDLYIAFTEIQASDISETSLGTSISQSAVGTPGGSLSSQISVAGSSGQLQYNNGSNSLAAYTPEAARTHLGLEIATTQGSASGGKVLRTISGGLTTGELISITSGGELSSLAGTGVVAQEYPFGTLTPNTQGRLTAAKTNTHSTHIIGLSGSTSAANLTDNLRNSADANPFYTHYMVAAAPTDIPSGILEIKYPDPNSYALGVTLTISFTNTPAVFGHTGGSTNQSSGQAAKFIRLTKDSSSFTGNEYINGDTTYVAGSTPSFFLTPGGSITLSVATYYPTLNGGTSQKAWQIIGHYDRMDNAQIASIISGSN